MNAPLPHPTDDATLHALVDGRLPTPQAAQLHTSLDAPAQDNATAWTDQRARLQTLHSDWLERPLPEALRQAAERLQDKRTEQRRWATWGGVAAGWLLAFGLGWQAHGPWIDPAPGSGMAAATPARFAHQAAVAHAVYQPEQRHPVEVDAAQQAHLLQWLSKRLGRPLRLPQLSVQGFELMGGRLLPGDSGARAQFMYQDAAGQRITLYLGALDAATRGETSFRFSDNGPVPGFYWVDGGFGYALSGALPRQRLLELATAVYQQLEATPVAPKASPQTSPAPAPQAGR